MKPSSSVLLAVSVTVLLMFVFEVASAQAIEVLPHFQALPDKAPPAPASEAPILYFGRLSAEKGVEDLLRAKVHLPEVRIIIAGEGPERACLEALTHALDLKHVEFVGHLQNNELERHIAAARFTVLPSHAYETLGKTILESYAQGRAVVASDLGSRREFVRHGETGLLYPPGDVRGLAEKLRFLCDHRERAEEMGRTGRDFVHSRHSPAAHCQAMTGLYERLQASRNASSPIPVKQSPLPSSPKPACGLPSSAAVA